jgi:hypothetical protein
MSIAAFAFWIALAPRAEAKNPQCSPACDVNEVCTPAGRCVTPCIPACQAGTTCDANGMCVDSGAFAPKAAAPITTVGGAKLCVARRPNETAPRVRWSVLIDGRIAGGVAGGSEQCFDAEPGRRTVVVMYVDPPTGARQEASKTVEIGPSGSVHVTVAASGSNIVFE